MGQSKSLEFRQLNLKHMFRIHRLVSKHMKEKNSLGGFESNVTYLAHRLNWDHHDLIITLKKYPKLKNCSASNVSFTVTILYLKPIPDSFAFLSHFR